MTVRLSISYGLVFLLLLATPLARLGSFYPAKLSPILAHGRLAHGRVLRYATAWVPLAAAFPRLFTVRRPELRPRLCQPILRVLDTQVTTAPDRVGSDPFGMCTRTHAGCPGTWKSWLTNRFFKASV